MEKVDDVQDRVKYEVEHAEKHAFRKGVEEGKRQERFFISFTFSTMLFLAWLTSFFTGVPLLTETTFKYQNEICLVLAVLCALSAITFSKKKK